MSKFFFLKYLLIISFFTATVRAQWVHNDLSVSDTVLNFVHYKGNLFAATNNSIFLSTDNGLHWTVKNSGLGYRRTNDLAFDSNFLYAATDFGKVYRSSDNGDNWKSIGSGITANSLSSIITYSGKIFVGTPVGVFISTESGENWNNFSDGLSNKETNTLVSCGNCVLAGTQNGVYVYDSTNETWTPINNGPDKTEVFRLAVNNSNIFAGTSKGIFVSTDDGASWILVNDTLTTISSFAFAKNNIFYGSVSYDKCIFRSSLTFKDWSDISDGIKYVTSLTISGENFIAGTWGMGSGIWNRPLSQVVTNVSFSENSPLTFMLEQNYPNPFNPASNIGYEIPNSGNVLLQVYDILGRKVVTLVNKFEPAGIYNVEFHASNLPSGIYIYRLEANGFQAVKKLMILK